MSVFSSSKTPLLKKLRDSGELVLYHDYRSGSFSDLSKYGNDGSPTDVVWSDGLRFPDTTSKIQCSDSSEIQLTEGTLVVFGDFQSQTTSEYFISKEDVKVNYRFYCDSVRIRLFGGGGNNRQVAADIKGKRCLAVNIKNGEVPEVYFDGVYFSDMSGAITLTADDAPLYIGNDYNNGQNSKSPLKAALVINRKLTATEHAQLYGEFESIKF